MIQQLSGISIPGRGIIIVPGTTRPMPGRVATGYGAGGGIQLGYNKQRGAFLWGVEGNLSGRGGRGTSSLFTQLPPTALQQGNDLNVSRSVTINSSMSLLPRIGFAMPKDLIYVTAGPTWTNVTVGDAITDIADGALINAPFTCPGSFCTANFAQNPFVGSTSDRHVHDGFAFGLGWEHKLSRTASVGIDFRRASLGTRSYVGTTTIVETCNPPITIPVTSPPTASACGPGNSFSQLGPNDVSLTSNALNLKVNVHF